MGVLQSIRAGDSARAVLLCLRASALAAALTLTPSSAASAQTVEWTRQFGSRAHDRAFAVAVHASSIYVAGATEDALPGQRSAGAVDAFVRKYDANGVEIWTRQFGTSGIDEVLAIAVDPSGIYVAGDAEGSLSGQVGSLERHAFVRKYDPGGTAVWTREFGSRRGDEVLGLAVAPAGVYAVGDTTLFAPPYDDGFVVRFGLDGAMGWGHRLGTAQEDRASAIAMHPSGVYVAGTTQGTLPGQTSVGDADGFLRKYDFDGSEVWTRQFGTPEEDDILAIAIDDAGVYLAGLTHGTVSGQAAAGIADAVLYRFGFDGQPLWASQFGTAAYDDALGVAVGGDSVYVGGNTRGRLAAGARTGPPGPSDLFVRKHDRGGVAIWTHQLGGGHNELLGLAADTSAAYAVGATDGSLPGQKNAGNVDAFVIKLH